LDDCPYIYIVWNSYLTLKKRRILFVSILTVVLAISILRLHFQNQLFNGMNIAVKHGMRMKGGLTQIISSKPRQRM
ncbi:hypothetical protein RBH29_16440, partial [Herbivorax sp. ANBcel31]|uniref:hypothetical protein n=1 Tax=Herbivorax sp. ANBcel31 TaxID=3069754 RepID=UPI0027ADBB9F